MPPVLCASCRDKLELLRQYELCRPGCVYGTQDLVLHKHYIAVYWVQGEEVYILTVLHIAQQLVGDPAHNLFIVPATPSRRKKSSMAALPVSFVIRHYHPYQNNEFIMKLTSKGKLYKCFSVFILILSSNAFGQIYKCQEFGRSVYSDTPCAENQEGALIQRARTQEEVQQEKIRLLEAENRALQRRSLENERNLQEANKQYQTAPIYPAAAPERKFDVSIQEQTRRCNIEKGNLTRRQIKNQEEGPACLTLRAMLNMPEPPKTIINNNRAAGSCFVNGNIINCH